MLPRSLRLTLCLFWKQELALNRDNMSAFSRNEASGHSCSHDFNMLLSKVFAMHRSMLRFAHGHYEAAGRGRLILSDA